MTAVGLVRVELTARLQVRNGGLLHPGEVAGLPAAEADNLVRRGGAKYFQDETRAPQSPPKDKMVRGAKKK